ncbi:hypothetical protein DL98DRAFT_621517 [Cadophora sp. DSE1049]|nr:hypothetical protein DL98DRAFT_621517 [Cadophora sp. DSE1049]
MRLKTSALAPPLPDLSKMDIRDTKLFQMTTKGSLERFIELLNDRQHFKDPNIFQEGKDLSDPANEFNQRRIEILLRNACLNHHISIMRHLIQQPSVKAYLGRPKGLPGVNAIITGDPYIVRLVAKVNPSYATEYKYFGHGLSSTVTQALWLPRDKCLPILKVLEECGARFDVDIVQLLESRL